MTPEWTKPAAVIALLLLGSGLLCISVRAPDKEDFDARPLRAGASVKRTLGGGERHLYRVSIEPGDAFGVVFNPERNDLAFTLVDPLRSNRLQVDSRNGYHGTELLSVVADIRGYHLLEVRAPPGSAASYELTVGKPRPATRDDRLRAAATSAFSRGELLFDVDGEKSAAWYHRALSLWEQAGELERATATRFRLGRVLQNQGEWEEAQEVYQTALAQARSRGDGLAEASLLDRIGRSHYEMGRLDAADRAYEQSRRLFRQEGYGPGEADALSDMGLVYRRRGDFEKGLKLGLEALDLYRTLKRPRDQALLLWNIGELYLGLGELRSALDAFEQAGEIGQALDRPDLLAPSLAGQGTALTELGDLSRASSLLERAVELSQQFDRRWEVSGRIRLGDVYARAGRFQDARDQYEGALKVARDARYRRGEAMALGNLGHVLDRMHMEQTAIGHFDEARSILQELGDPDGVAKVLKGRAEAALGLGDVEAARSSAEAGIRIVEDLRSPLPNAFSDRRELYDLYVEILMRLHEKEPARQLDRL
ncbi:MAG: tetratricopeptide repeat protein, partial [Thermoanaerobaculia bacterium]